MAAEQSRHRRHSARWSEGAGPGRRCRSGRSSFGGCVALRASEVELYARVTGIVQSYASMPDLSLSARQPSGNLANSGSGRPLRDEYPRTFLLLSRQCSRADHRWRRRGRRRGRALLARQARQRFSDPRDQVLSRAGRHLDSRRRSHRLLREALREVRALVDHVVRDVPAFAPGVHRVDASLGDRQALD